MCEQRFLSLVSSLFLAIPHANSPRRTPELHFLYDNLCHRHASAPPYPLVSSLHPYNHGLAIHSLDLSTIHLTLLGSLYCREGGIASEFPR
jgi:hypothetical protein